jgi:hypothetical protein
MATLLLFTGGSYIIMGVPLFVLIFIQARIFVLRRMQSNIDTSSGRMSVEIPNGRQGRMDMNALSTATKEAKEKYGAEARVYKEIQTRTYRGKKKTRSQRRSEKKKKNE